MNPDSNTERQPESRAHYTRQAAAEHFDIGLRSIDRMIAAGKLRVVRIGRSVRIPSSEIKRLQGN